MGKQSNFEYCIGAVSTTLGTVAFIWSAKGLVANSFFYKSLGSALKEIAPLARKLGIEKVEVSKSDAPPAWIGKFFTAYANGDGKTCKRLLSDSAKFDFALATDHRKKVWNSMLSIPWGATATYGELSAKIKSAPRAVGGACGANRCPVIIPCHRVIGAGGDLRGFGGGIKLKAMLLAHEGIQAVG
ncbi:MAG: methylated-DNA--[protein]-cysteine S-methyltransferase [bacterium]|jgi:O-6-methylguanine DNA methyltransferase